MRSHFSVVRTVAVACSAAAAPAVCTAQQVASDSPAHPVYDNGWQVGDNGGFGFGPWNMFGTYTTPIQNTLDSTSPPNNVRVTPVNGGPARSWTLYNADAPPGPGSGTDISRAGRALLTPLQVGQTISVVIDNPTERRFFRGYTVRFNTGGGNVTYGGAPVSRMSIGTFEYFTYGRWYVNGGATATLFDTDTATQGVRISMTLNTPNTFTVTMTPLTGPALPFTTSGTLQAPANSLIDWVEFETYNTDSDWYPSQTQSGNTDFYIASMEVGTGPPGCYANCDGSTQPPVLNVGDFTCFLQKYALGHPYANCDLSITPPALNVGDFTCFLQKYALGCP